MQRTVEVPSAAPASEPGAVSDADGFDSSWANDFAHMDLPVLPDVTQQVMKMAADPNSSLQALANVLNRDAATAAHVMRLANSPMYRGREPIVSLHQAAARLGTMKLRDVAVIVASESKLFRSRGFEKEARRAFSHGLLTGLWAQEIARRQRGAVEEAFLCGLLHDVGIPVLLQAATDRVADAASHREHILAVVHERHASVGAELCRLWKLPERLAQSLQHHHEPLPNPSGALGAVIALADDLAEFCEAAEVIDEGQLSTFVGDHPATAGLNLYDDDIVALVRLHKNVLGTSSAISG